MTLYFYSSGIFLDFPKFKLYNNPADVLAGLMTSAVIVISYLFIVVLAAPPSSQDDEQCKLQLY